LRAAFLAFSAARYNAPAIPVEQTEHAVTIVVVGAGAIGLLVAGRLAESGQRTALLARPTTAAAFAAAAPCIREAGTTVAAEGLLVVGSPDELPAADRPPELAILAVKGYDTFGALPALEELQPRALLSLQNGLGNEELLAGSFGPERVIAGAITTSVEVVSQGLVAVTKRGGIGLAPVAPSAPVRPAAEALAGAGFVVRGFDSYRALKWSKVLLNILGNATAAILDMPVAQVYADARLAALERRAFLEALAVMERLGAHPVNLPGMPAALLALAIRRLPAALLYPLLRRAVAGGRGGKPPSLQLDLARGRERTEARQLYGAIAEEAARVGVPAPVNQALWRTVRAIAAGERSWDEFRRNPARLLAEVRPQ
jgi:2-dehydropantoate 2-reductase